MAKKSAVAKNEKRKRVVERYRERRTELKKIIKDETKSIEEREDAARQLRRLPRDASPIRVRNRCAVTGRPRAYYRRFGLCRNVLRELGLQGMIPGVKKSSW
jgi:small subunit ribosomal protein S14